MTILSKGLLLCSVWATVASAQRGVPAKKPPVAATRPAKKPPLPERFWIGGRYDSTRVIIYFEAVKFEETLEKNSVKIPAPQAEGFFGPVAIQRTYAAKFLEGQLKEHFAVGDRYDLLLGDGRVATITLSSLVGCETDEGTGNDSYIGALATVAKADRRLFTKNYYVVRRHVAPPARAATKKKAAAVVHAALGEDLPVGFGAEVDSVLKARIAVDTAEQLQALARNQAVLIKEIQTVTLAGGTRRYFYRSVGSTGTSCLNLSGWVSPSPTHLLSLTDNECLNSAESPRILNVIDLGGGRTGIIVNEDSGGAVTITLRQYRDGVALREMRVWQVISAGD